MKVTKLFPLTLLAAFALSGCGGSGAAIQDLNADKILDNYETAVLLSKIKKATNAVSKIDMTMTGKYQDAAKVEESKITGTQTFYKNGGFKLEQKMYNKDVQNALTFEQEGTVNEYYARLDDKHYFDVAETKGSENFYYEEIYNVGEDFDDNLIRVDQVDGMMGYVLGKADKAARRKDGTYYLYQTVLNDQYVAVEFGKNITREEHRIQKQQAVVELNADYSIKTFTVAASLSSNIDPTTKEVYAQPKVINEQSEVYNVSYGDLAEYGEEVTSRATTIKEVSRLVASQVKVNGYVYDEETKELIDGEPAVLAGYTITRTAHNAYHVAVVDTYIFGVNNAFSLEFGYSTTVGSEEPGVAKKAALDRGDIVNSINELEKVEGKEGIYYNAGGYGYLKFVIEFDVTVAEGEANLSNLSIIIG